MTFYPRAAWGSKYKATVRITQPVSNVFIHHSVTPSAPERSQVQGMERHHVETRKFSAIAYSFLVGQSGDVYEGRGWGITGGHTLGHNTTSYAVCGIGNFETEAPTPAMLQSMAAVIREGCDLGFIRPTFSLRGHRDVGQTTCPGLRLYNHITTIRALLQEDDMPLTDAEIIRISEKVRLDMLGDIQTAIKDAAFTDDDVERVARRTVELLREVTD